MTFLSSLVAAIVFVLSLSLSPAILAQTPGGDAPPPSEPPAGEESPAAPLNQAGACMRDVGNALNRERFLYETVLFGLKPAEEEQVNATRVDGTGITWIKTDDDTWATASEEDPLTDQEMDEATATDQGEVHADVDADDTGDESDDSFGDEEEFGRPGILQTQKAVTSDLLPPVLQSFRAFQCRAMAVCQAASIALSRPFGLDEDLERDALGNLTVSVPGCIPLQQPLFEHCQPNPLFSANETINLHTFCEPAALQLIQYHEEQLAFLAHYDAAHRTLRQFAGFLEPVLDVVSFPFLTPVRQAADFLGWWTRVPCFQPFCVQKK